MPAAPAQGAEDADARLFSLLLRARDCPEAASWVPPGERRQVVFLHGWLQDHASWLTTAHRVRARHGHDCLLLDWPAHGRSPAPADPTALSATTLVGCLRRLLERAGWAGSRGRLVLAGCSLGGAVAMRYASLHADDRGGQVGPRRARRLRGEPWYMLSRPGPLLSRLCSLPLLPPRFRGRLSIVRHTPLYQNAPDWFATAVARRTPTLLVFAQFDELHRAQAWAGCRAGDPLLRLRRVLPRARL
ncbi:unnamed protein product [Prorocentrum cordatum]|uniref:AB hydrolase-1 domain-containing protein n=1 Tax=Prorocentrum cordatum TaxID=2364126 RepID=A0ABN9WBR5_9DINO|nr:unnamed protein product [Polarella glacialis]